MSDIPVRTTIIPPLPSVHWGAVIAGGLVAAALASVLHAFGAAIGLAVSSTAPTWRDASIALWILSGLYLVLVALLSYGVGGYVAGLIHQPSLIPVTTSTDSVIDDREMQDGLHGLLVWAMATLLAVLLLLGAASAATRLASPSTVTAGPSASVVGENIIAFDLDRLLRGDRRQTGDSAEMRAEAARILLTASSHGGVAAEDRAHLVRVIAGRTGMAPADSERRVDAAIASARDNISRARRSTVILAFMAGAAALLGAAAAWFAAVAGGEQRDGNGKTTWHLFRSHKGRRAF